MQSIKEKVSFYLSAVVYVLFNLRLGADVLATVKATLWQMVVETGYYVVGITYVIIALLQYMADGEKLPWDRRLRLFFAVGIMVGLYYAIYNYAGVDVGRQ